MMLFQLIVLLKPREDAQNNYSHLERQAGNNNSDLQNSISFQKKNPKLLFRQDCGIWTPKSTWVALEKGKAGGASPGMWHHKGLGWGLHIQQSFPWGFPTIIQHTHGKTNPLLAWISIQGMIFVTKKHWEQSLVTPFLLLLINLPFTHGKNMDSAFSTGLGAGRMGRRSPCLPQIGFCVLLNQIPGVRQKIPNKFDIKNLNVWRNLRAFTRAQQPKQCRDVKYSSWDVSAGCELPHLSLSWFLLFLIHVQPRFFQSGICLMRPIQHCVSQSFLRDMKPPTLPELPARLCFSRLWDLLWSFSSSALLGEGF